MASAYLRDILNKPDQRYALLAKTLRRQIHALNAMRRQVHVGHCGLRGAGCQREQCCGYDGRLHASIPTYLTYKATPLLCRTASTHSALEPRCRTLPMPSAKL